MDTPADLATPLKEVYQAFFADLATEGRKQSTVDRYRYNIVRFEKWLAATGRPLTIASLERTTLIAYRQYLESLPQQARGSKRRRQGGLLSRHTVHSYLRSIKCLSSWMKGAGLSDHNPFLGANPYFKRKGVMPVLRADDRIPRIGKPSDVALLLAGCTGDRPEDLRDRALVWLHYSSGIRANEAVNLTLNAIDFETGILTIENGKGDKDRPAFISPVAAKHVRAYIERGRIPLLERMPRRHGPVPASAGPDGSKLITTDVLFLSGRGRKGEIGLTSSGILQVLTRRYQAGGGTLASFGPHRLRHGMATYMAEQGVDQREIQRWGGWANIETVSIYVHMDTTRIRSEQNRVQGPLFEQLAAAAMPKFA